MFHSQPTVTMLEVDQVRRLKTDQVLETAMACETEIHCIFDSMHFVLMKDYPGKGLSSLRSNVST